MINLNDKHNCCGCTACAERCPQECITMQSDAEGFLYPVVDVDRCVQCGLCERVCPILNQRETSIPKIVYAARHKDRVIVSASSSGGIFTSLATHVIKKGGVVFGAKFNEHWNVVMSCTETMKGLKDFQGSKYVQCDVGDCFRKAEEFLKKERIVLFSGTPCQIAGLKAFLNKEYEKLITVSIICHGAPSPGIWEEYKKQIPAKLVAGKNTVFSSLKSLPMITGINFRDKTEGWQKYGFSASGSADQREAENSVFPPKCYNFHEYHRDNLFIRGFLNNLYLRPSCHQCPARKGRSGSDIQLADYWGVRRRTPDFYDPNGVSLVLIFSEKGSQLFDELDVLKKEVGYDDVLDCNPNVEIDEIEPAMRQQFFSDYRQHGLKTVAKYCDKIEGHDILWHIKKYMFKVKQIIKK